jgi:cytochrome c-type biogenesis protein CcmH/NrfG
MQAGFSYWASNRLLSRTQKFKKKKKEKAEADWAALGFSPAHALLLGQVGQVGRFAVVGCTQQTSHGPK